MDEFHDDMKRLFEQFSARLEQVARQPRLTMEADGPANTKTRERTEGAAIAVQAMRGDSCTTAQTVQDGPNTSISFGVMTEPPDLPCREVVLVEDGATSPESCLPPLEMRTSTAAGGLIPTGETSTTETTVNKPLLQFYSTEEEDSKKETLWTSIPSAWYDISFWKLLAAPYCRRVVETKSRQNRMFDRGGSQGYLRACPFSGSWRALVCGKVVRAGAAGKDCSSFFGASMIRGLKVFGRAVQAKFDAVRRAFFRRRFADSLSKRGQPRTRCAGKKAPSRVARGHMSRRNGGHVVDDGSRMSGVNGERGALDGELDANPAERRAIWSGHRLHGQYTLSSTTSIMVC